MEVNFTPDQKAFIRQAIESGRLHREEDAVQEALSLWEERERTRAEILTAVDVACTRARDYLLVTSVEPASEFLDDLQIPQRP